MEMYKQASRLCLRFQTSKGPLSVEQLWSLSMKDLANSIKAVNEVLKKESGDELSFLSETTEVVDVENSLRFAILKDVYVTKKSEMENARDEAKRKEERQKIMGIIARKQENALEEMSIEDLTKMLDNK